MKTRLDVFLVEKGLYQTRNKAKMAIENGDILVDSVIVDKVSYQVDESNNIEILKNSIPYVSRGGLKLEKALTIFNVDVNNKVCLDIGASTGGFTDCLLQNKANLVYALDVGSNQLDNKLKNISKVIVLENTNFRSINTDDYKNKNISIITADVSFISITYLFENITKILNDDGLFIGLIKPQFETSKKEHNKNGVVNDKRIHLIVIQKIIHEANNNGLYLNELTYSPIKGEKSGNIEYLAKFSFNEQNISLNKIRDIIDIAFKNLK